MATKKNAKPTKQKMDFDDRINAIAAKIKRLRLEAGYTNYENFAYDFEMGRMQYWRLEKGKNMRLDTLFKVLDAHQLTLKEFFSDID